MVGLSVVLEAHKGGGSSNSISKKNTPQVINKTTMMLGTSSTSINTASSFPPRPLVHPPPQPFLFQPPTFLDKCFLCNKRLLPGNDIYMYKGDRAFCSVDCRCKQIFTDEEEAIKKGNCSLDAMRPTSSSSSSSSAPTHNNGKGGPNNRGGGDGGFAY